MSVKAAPRLRGKDLVGIDPLDRSDGLPAVVETLVPGKLKGLAGNSTDLEADKPNIVCA